MFQTNETSILGECETIYTIAKLPGHLVVELQENELQRDSTCEGKEHFEIIKTKNLDNCSDRPVYHKSVGGHS